jgi:hypothetical protein
MEHPLRREDGVVSNEYAWPFVKCTYRTCSMLLKVLPFALYTSPLSVQCLHSKVKVTLRLTVNQSVSQSWCRAPSGAHDQRFIIV